MKSEISNINQKIKSYYITIKQLELQFSLMLTQLNQSQISTLPSNTVQNYKNEGQYMASTTRGGKSKIYPPMPLDEDNN